MFISFKKCFLIKATNESHENFMEITLQSIVKCQDECSLNFIFREKADACYSSVRDTGRCQIFYVLCEVTIEGSKPKAGQDKT